MTTNRPRIGAQVRYTDLGMGMYYQRYGCWPPHGGVLGTVFGISGSGGIAKVKTPDRKTESFIWRFSDGVNNYFSW